MELDSVVTHQYVAWAESFVLEIIYKVGVNSKPVRVEEIAIIRN